MDQAKVDREQPSPAQQRFWLEFFQLKVDACYIRDYRNGVGRWVTITATIRAIASSGGIAAWVIWRRYALLWAAIIALSQLFDALKDVFPFYKQRRRLSQWVKQLNLLFVFAQRDWDDIRSGKYSDEQSRMMIHKLRSRKQRLEARFIPDGLPRRDALFKAAEREAANYFTLRYDVVERQLGEPHG